MGDVITTKAVLAKSVDSSRLDYLYLFTPRDIDRRCPFGIACEPKGETRERMGTRQVWQYEERDGRLHVTPSLLCTDNGFHTDFNWSVDYVVCTGGEPISLCCHLNQVT